MKLTARLILGAIVLMFGTGAAVAEEAAAFGYIQHVEFEPDAQAPQRIQVWGTFSVATREAGKYQIPEDGYLYFALPEMDQEKARAEWRELARWPKAKVAALSNASVPATGQGLRVWIDGEPGAKAEVYQVGYAFDRGGEGVQLLRDVPKDGGRHYVVVDRVEAVPNAEAPTEVRIWGTFSIQGQVDRGYVEFATKPGAAWAEALKKWRAVARTGRPVAFYTQLGSGDLRVRPEDQASGAPDQVLVLNIVLSLRTDTWYRPVRMLVGTKCLAGGGCY